jgi:hypothetical protein
VGFAGRKKSVQIPFAVEMCYAASSGLLSLLQMKEQQHRSMTWFVGVSLAVKEMNKVAFSGTNPHLADDSLPSQLYRAIQVHGESLRCLLPPIGRQNPVSILTHFSIIESRYVFRDPVEDGLYYNPIYK